MTKLPPYNELDWQARWLTGELGQIFFSEEGQRIEIQFPGHWNREPGPDFRDAQITINGGQKIKGDIELDTHVSDWESHGHSTNPDFEKVILHVFLNRGKNTYFTRTRGFRYVPQICLSNHQAEPKTFSLRKFSKPQLPLNQAIPLLEEAAMRRLHRKAELLQRIIYTQGVDQALFQLLAGSMGYKRNSLPFTILAQRVTLHRARETTGEALLFGLAGFLQGDRFSFYSEETKDYIRKLWKDWWKMRSEMERWIFPAIYWRYGGHHPTNHPHRRLATLHLIAKHWRRIRQGIDAPEYQSLQNILLKLQHPYWNRYVRLDGTKLKRCTALLGLSRCSDIIINVYYPWQLLRGKECWVDFKKMSAKQISTEVFRHAKSLVGNANAHQLTRKIIYQQGLLEIFNESKISITPGRTFKEQIRDE